MERPPTEWQNQPQQPYQPPPQQQQPHGAGYGYPQQQGGYPQQPPSGGYVRVPLFPDAPPPPPRRSTGKLVALTILVTCLALVVAGGGFVAYRLYTSQAHDMTAAEEYAISPQRVYDNLGTALKEQNEVAYLECFQGAETKRRARILYRNLVKIPFQVARYEEIGTPYQGNVAFVHQVQGVDVAPVYEQYKFVFATRSDDSEVITNFGGSAEPVRTLSETYFPAPWDMYANMSVARKGNVVVIADAEHKADMDRFAPYIARGAEDDAAAWNRAHPVGDRTSKGALVVLESDRKAYDKLYTGMTARHDSLEAGANLALPGFKANVGGAVTGLTGGSRIVMDSSLSHFTSTAWRQGVTEISRHEIAHAMAATYTRSLVVSPATWVAEGFASYMELRDNATRARYLNRALEGYHFGLGSEPPNDDSEFYSSDSKERNINYALSRLALQYMVKKYGDKAAFEFVAAEYSSPTKEEGNFQKYLGVDRGTFWDGWKGYVRAEVPGLGTAT
ncbi:hypothetical protein GCM10009612_01340 [Streptomyces beijiangensis]